mgnify:FL=1
MKKELTLKLCITCKHSLFDANQEQYYCMKDCDVCIVTGKKIYIECIENRSPFSGNCKLQGILWEANEMQSKS